VIVNVDVAARGFGIRTGLVRAIHQPPGNVAIQTRQANVEASLERVASVETQVHFGIYGRIGRELDLHFAGHKPIALMKQADHPAANNCLGLVPLPGMPGTESLTSSRPSEVRDVPPSLPPMVWAFGSVLLLF
jgi:hypothetical protein